MTVSFWCRSAPSSLGSRHTVGEGRREGVVSEPPYSPHTALVAVHQTGTASRKSLRLATIPWSRPARIRFLNRVRGGLTSAWVDGSCQAQAGECACGTPPGTSAKPGRRGDSCTTCPGCVGTGTATHAVPRSGRASSRLRA